MWCDCHFWYVRFNRKLKSSYQLTNCSPTVAVEVYSHVCVCVCVCGIDVRTQKAVCPLLWLEYLACVSVWKTHEHSTVWQIMMCVLDCR